MTSISQQQFDVYNELFVQATNLIIGDLPSHSADAVLDLTHSAVRLALGENDAEDFGLIGAEERVVKEVAETLRPRASTCVRILRTTNGIQAYGLERLLSDETAFYVAVEDQDGVYEVFVDLSYPEVPGVCAEDLIRDEMQRLCEGLTALLLRTR